MSGRGVSESDGLYVGYRALPARHRRALAVVVVSALLGFPGMAAVIAWGQRDAGDGVWAAEVSEVAGWLVVEPYPMVVDDDGGSWLLVEVGKMGLASGRGVGGGGLMDGSRVRARGLTLSRESAARVGARMLELLPGDEGLSGVAGGGDWAGVSLARGGERVLLRGEILDSKCFLGAMKPGDGRGHRSCAVLCISGGVPPMVRGVDGDGVERLLLVVGGDGGAANAEVAGEAGLRVLVVGEVGSLGGVGVLFLDSVERLGW